MLETLKKVLINHKWFSSQDILESFILNSETYEFIVGNSAFIVCTEEGAEELLRYYREASIDAAKLDIPEIYHKFFEFNDFANYTWQSLYDIYDIVDEVEFEGKKYYICSL